MSLEKIDGIKKVKKAMKSAEELAHGPQGTANKDYFESLMLQQSKKKETVEAAEQVDEATKKPSLIDTVSQQNHKFDGVAKVDPNDLISQTHQVSGEIEKLKAQLSAPESAIKPNYQPILQNRLTHINENLQIALSKAGVEYQPKEKPTAPSVNPIERFLGYLTDGQYQLDHLGDEVQLYASNHKTFSPADMIAIQVKVNYVQQELSFFTNVLNQALTSTKTLLNVQV